MKCGLSFKSLVYMALFGVVWLLKIRKHLNHRANADHNICSQCHQVHTKNACRSRNNRPKHSVSSHSIASSSYSGIEGGSGHSSDGVSVITPSRRTRSSVDEKNVPCSIQEPKQTESRLSAAQVTTLPSPLSPPEGNTSMEGVSHRTNPFKIPSTEALREDEEVARINSSFNSIPQRRMSIGSLPHIIPKPPSLLPPLPIEKDDFRTRTLPRNPNKSVSTHSQFCPGKDFPALVPSASQPQLPGTKYLWTRHGSSCSIQEPTSGFGAAGLPPWGHHRRSFRRQESSYEKLVALHYRSCENFGFKPPKIDSSYNILNDNETKVTTFIKTRDISASLDTSSLPNDDSSSNLLPPPPDGFNQGAAQFLQNNKAPFREFPVDTSCNTLFRERIINRTRKPSVKYESGFWSIPSGSHQTTFLGADYPHYTIHTVPGIDRRCCTSSLKYHIHSGSSKTTCRSAGDQKRSVKWHRSVSFEKELPPPPPSSTTSSSSSSSYCAVHGAKSNKGKQTSSLQTSETHSLKGKLP